VPRIEIAYDGQLFESREALARLLGCNNKTAVYLLNKHSDDAAAVFASGGVRAPPPRKSILYEGQAFTRQDLVRHLVQTKGYDFNRLVWLLKKHRDDVPAAVKAYDRLTTRLGPVTVAGAAYRSRAAFARALQQRFGVPANPIRQLLVTQSPEAVLQWAQTRQDRGDQISAGVMMRKRSPRVS
jgi:hypothetical protein